MGSITRGADCPPNRLNGNHRSGGFYYAQQHLTCPILGPSPCQDVSQDAATCAPRPDQDVAPHPLGRWQGRTRHLLWIAGMVRAFWEGQVLYLAIISRLGLGHSSV